MIAINLIDTAFLHLHVDSGRFSSVHGKISKHIRYVRNLEKFDGITIFTDSCLQPQLTSQVKSKYKIGWLMENRYVNNLAYDRFPEYIDHLDYVLTHDSELLKQYPEKCIKVPFGGGWIKEENFGIPKKTKLASIIYSHKKGPHEGYVIRHKIAEKYKDKIDLFGNGSPNPIDNKEDALSDYMFSVVVENVDDTNYFTEKLIDPLLVGTIPIYWGCPNIGEFIDERGIIKFDMESFDDIFNSLNEEKYNSMLEYANINLGKAKTFEITDDWIYENIIWPKKLFIT